MSITKKERIEGNDREAEDAIFQDLRGKRFFAITTTTTLTSPYRAWLSAFLNPHTHKHNPHRLEGSTLRNIKHPSRSTNDE